MKRIVFNCVPPFSINRPSPALSILKSWLKKYGHNSEIIYWNLIFYDLQNDFVWNDPTVLGTSNTLALYINYLICNGEDRVMYNSFKKLLQGYSTRYLNEGDDYYDRHMKEYANKVDLIIENVLLKTNIYEIPMWGFSIKMDCWIMSSIISKKIKTINPNAIIVIGGINTKQSAISYLENFPEFDIAMWGEGEEHLAQLVDTVNNGGMGFSNVGNIAYKNNGKILISEAVNMKFSDMSEEELYPNYDDYFQQKGYLINSFNSVIPIEGSRGCHWNKCKFCYLNEDYKYRLKSIDKICKEIRYMIDKYKIYNFEFLDNDFIGLNIKRNHVLLDSIINIKKEEPRFRIEIAEVITKGLDEYTIKKLFNAGIIFAQIGYESPSQSLLRKIKKKNSFASNLLYIKFATLYQIPLFNVNVLTSMPDENEEDILEAIENLKFLRFFLHSVKFKHILVPVQVNSTSRYFTIIKNEISNWIPSTIAYDYLLNLIKREHHWNIFTFVKRSYNFHWDTFKRIEKYYLDNKHNYSIIKAESTIIFTEYNNGRMTNKINIEKESIEDVVLTNTNELVMSLEKLILSINNSQNKHKYTKQDVINTIDFFSSNGLMYNSIDYSEIVSVINYSAQ